MVSLRRELANEERLGLEENEPRAGQAGLFDLEEDAYELTIDLNREETKLASYYKDDPGIAQDSGLSPIMNFSYLYFSRFCCQRLC